MGRNCSHCGNTGHNSRTCTIHKACTTTTVVAGLRLFGVLLDISSPSSPSSSSSSVVPIERSFSMDCLSTLPPPTSSSPSPPSSLPSSRVSVNEVSHHKTSVGYHSDDPFCGAPERKKGVAWTEEEHRTFLMGLERLGKGDWRGISRNFVRTRTPTQVASHAQKYFLRRSSPNKRKRRSSLFDMVEYSRKEYHRINYGSNSNPNVPNSLHYVSRTKSSCHEAHHHQDTIQSISLIDLNSYEQHINNFNNVDDGDNGYSQIVPGIDHAMPISLHGSANCSTLQYSSTTTMPQKCPIISPSVVPNLELTLAAPIQMDSQQPPSSSLLVDPVSVT